MGVLLLFFASSPPPPPPHTPSLWRDGVVFLVFVCLFGLPYLTRRKTQITNLLSLPEAVLIKAFNSIDRVHRGGLVGGR